ncbi:MAG TPA: hypothetical protein VIM65_05775 [Cyclobacteriaceae bacterium]
MKLDWVEKYMTDAEHLITDDQLEQGLGILTNLLYEEPGYGSLHNHLGWAYLYYANDTAKAELHFSMAMRFDTEYAAPYLHMGTLCIRAHRYNDAIKYAEQGLTKPNANKVALHEIIGNAYELKSDYRKAIKAYKAAAISSLDVYEINNLTAGIKRCKKKRIALFFSF